MSASRFSALVAGMRVFDLSHALFPGMPMSPAHPPYTFSLVRRHGDVPRDDGVCTANELIVMCGHSGTHMDALGHASRQGRLRGDLPAADVQAGGKGLKQLGIETVAPLVSRGVLLDVASTLGCECLDAAYEVTVADLEAAERRGGVTVSPGDTVLIRSGWSVHWPDRDGYESSSAGTPGPGPDGAGWLAERGVVAAGSDTLVFEVVRPGRNVRPVHGLFLVDRGIHIMEGLNLEELSRQGPAEFLFVASPLKFTGGTGSPIRPLALALPVADTNSA